MNTSRFLLRIQQRIRCSSVEIQAPRINKSTGSLLSHPTKWTVIAFRAAACDTYVRRRARILLEMILQEISRAPR